MKYRRINKKNVILCIVLIIGIILVMLGIFKVINSKNKLIGSWTTDGVTVYEFNKNGKGKLILPLAEYEFNYKTKSNKLSIDFINDKSEDSDYTYSFKMKKLVLEGEKGVFIFSKKN